MKLARDVQLPTFTSPIVRPRRTIGEVILSFLKRD